VTVTALVLAGALTRPLRRLRKGLEAVGKGEFARRLPTDTRDEIGELAETFNEMRDQLAESRRKLARHCARRADRVRAVGGARGVTGGRSARRAVRAGFCAPPGFCAPLFCPDLKAARGHCRVRCVVTETARCYVFADPRMGCPTAPLRRPGRFNDVRQKRSFTEIALDAREL